MITNAPSELDQVIQRLNLRDSGVATASKRKRERFAYVMKNIKIEVEARGDAERTITGATRNLSSNGANVVTERFLYVGTQLSLNLVTRRNAWQAVRGQVVRCNYISGSRRYYDIGVKFFQPIEVAAYLDSDQRRIAVIDDSPAIAVLVERILSGANMRCRSATSGADGIKLLDEGEFDVALIDVEMPGMSGVECVQSLRQNGCAIPVLAIATPDKQSVDELKAFGFDGVIHKPFKPREVLEALAAACTPELQSTLSNEGDFADALQMFVGRLRELQGALRRAMRGNDLEAISKVAWQLAAEGGGFGFEPISEAAREVVSAIEGRSNHVIPVTKLMRLCNAAVAE